MGDDGAPRAVDDPLAEVAYVLISVDLYMVVTDYEGCTRSVNSVAHSLLDGGVLTWSLDGDEAYWS